jgi:hypothetical protein
MDKVPPEEYTLDIELLTDVFLDGMMSGVSTALMNVMPELGTDESRNQAGIQLSRAVQDPVFVETIRDSVRARVRGNLDHEGTLLRIPANDED